MQPPPRSEWLCLWMTELPLQHPRQILAPRTARIIQFRVIPILAGRSAHRRSLAKLYPAFLLDAGLLDGVQLALELRQLSGYLAVSADKKGCGPEHDDSHAGCDLIVRPLLILGTG